MISRSGSTVNQRLVHT